MKQKILILGGTGAMGVYLCEELFQHPDYEVYITSRSPRASRGNLHYLCGNAHHSHFLAHCLETLQPDAVVDFMIWTTAEFEAVSSMLLEHTKHYLFLSSYRVFAEQNPLTEHSARLLDVCTEAAYLQTDEYALAKARQENILRKSDKKNWTILRPCITYSKNRFQLGCLEAGVICLRSFQHLPVVIAKPMLDKQTTLTWGGDTARLIAKLILNPKAYAEDFNLSTAEHHTWREVASYYQEILGTIIQPVTLDEYISLMGGPWQTKYDRMFDRVLDNTKVLAATGYTQEQFMPLKEGLKRELTAFKQHPVFSHHEPWQNARMDRICHTAISLKGYSLQEKVVYYIGRYPLLAHFVPLQTAKKLKKLLSKSKKICH